MSFIIKLARAFTRAGTSTNRKRLVRKPTEQERQAIRDEVAEHLAEHREEMKHFHGHDRHRS